MARLPVYQYTVCVDLARHIAYPDLECVSDVLSRLSRNLGLPSLGPETLSLAPESSIRGPFALEHPEFAKLLEIQRHVARYISIMGREHESAQVNIPAVKIVESDLNQMPHNGWSRDYETDRCRAKLGLYALVCLESMTLVKATGPDHQQHVVGKAILEEYCLKGLYTALDLLRTFSTAIAELQRISPAAHDGAHPQTGPDVCIPKHRRSSASFAAFFLLNFCMDNPQIPPDDRRHAHAALRTAIQMYQDMSRSPLDEASRTAQVIRVLAQEGMSDAGGGDQRGRNSASIVYTSLHRAAELRGRRPDEEATNIPEVSLDDLHAEDAIVPTAATDTHAQGLHAAAGGGDAGPFSMPGSNFGASDNLDPWLSAFEESTDLLPWPFADRLTMVMDVGSATAAGLAGDNCSQF